VKVIDKKTTSNGSIVFARLCKCTCHLIHASLDPSESTSQTASQSVQQFLHSSWHRVPIHYNWSPIPPSKLPLYIRGPRYGSPSNTWFLWLTGVHSPNGISIGSAVFAGLTIMTDRPTERQTDHATPSVTIVQFHICSTVLRSNNNNNKQ